MELQVLDLNYLHLPCYLELTIPNILLIDRGISVHKIKYRLQLFSFRIHNLPLLDGEPHCKLPNSAVCVGSPELQACIFLAVGSRRVWSDL